MSAKSGFLFMFGIPGARATRETAALLKDTGACGVLLLARNIESPDQTRGLVEELQDKAGRPLLFSIDHEGGWVLRFTRGVTAFPGNAALGRVGDPALAYAVGRHMALELKALGIRLNLAPVLDVLTGRYNPGIGIRSFGADPALAGELGSAFIRGQQNHGVSATAKHFPGKGAATQDAHVALPTIRLPGREFERMHLAPFKAAVKAGVHCAMTSHVLFPALDRSGAPATFSPKITGGLLRRKLGFAGVIVSDDLCMGAVTRRWPIQQAALLALDSGHDILLIAHDPQVQREAAELLERSVDAGLVPAARVETSARRIQALMSLHHRSPAAPEPPTGGPELARLIARKAVELAAPGAVPLPLPLEGGKKRVLVVWPDFREVRDRFTFEGGVEGPLAALKKRLSRWPAKASVALSPIVTGAGKMPADADIVVFFCFEAMRFPGQKETLRRLQAQARDRLVVCLIRSSWDRTLLKPGVTCLDAYGYRACSIDALLDALHPGSAR